jgi:hypothetical protein
MQLLERAAALASLAGYAHEARHGDGRLVLVAGEAGLGQVRSGGTTARRPARCLLVVGAV